jgi:hypothetical protein
VATSTLCPSLRLPLLNADADNGCRWFDLNAAKKWTGANMVGRCGRQSQVSPAPVNPHGTPARLRAALCPAAGRRDVDCLADASSLSRPAMLSARRPPVRAEP